MREAEDKKEKIMTNLTLNDLLKAGVHFGHQKSRWNPKMSPFIFTQKEGIHIINLQQTQKKLEEALDFIAKLASEGKKILFVGTKRQAKKLVKEAAENCNMPYIVERWPGGTFTNFKTIKKQILKLKDLRAKREAGEFEKYTKKEQILIKEEIERLEKLFGGLVNLDELPDAIFILSIVHDHIPLREAMNINIPIISLVDTNSDPSLVDYPIPANDDAIKSIGLLCNAVSETIKKNYKEKVIKPTENKYNKIKK